MSGRDYVGRVGALAVALGVGGLIVALPGLASADSGRDGDAGGDATKPSKNAAGPARAGDASGDGGARRGADRLAHRATRAESVAGPASAVRAAATTPTALNSPASIAGASISAAPNVKGGTDPSAPVTEPLAWATLAVTRRQPAPAAAVPAPAPAPAAGYDAVTDRIATAGEQAWAQAQTSYSEFESFFAGIPASQVQQWLLDTQSAALLSAAQQVIAREARDLTPIAGTLAPIMVSGVRNWITNGTVGAQIDQIATDPTVLAFVAGWAGSGLSGLGLPPAVSAAVGNAAAGLLQNVFGGPANAAVRAAADAYLRTLPGGPEGWADTELLYELWQGGYGFGELIDDQIGAQALTGIPAFLADAAVRQALGAATGTAIGDLAADPAVASYVGGLIAGAVDGYVGAGPATAIGDAVAGLIPVLGDGLGAVAQTALTSLLGQPGVTAALGDAAAQVITAAWAKENVAEAISDALPGLLADPAVRTALGVAITDALGTVDTALLGDPDVTAALGEAVTSLVTRLAADPVAWAQLSAQVSDLTAGTGIGATIAGLLADPGLAVGLAGVAGDAVTGFLDAPGVSTALTDTAAQLATAVLAGANPYAALNNSWQTLQADASVQAAVAATLATVLQALGDPEVSDAVTVLVGELTSSPELRAVITDQLGAALGDDVAELLAPLGDGLADVIAPALDELLNAPGVGPVLTGVVAQVLAGTDPGEALQGVLETVAGDPALQAALGSAITGSVNTVLANAEIRGALGDAAGAAVGGALAGSGFAAVASQVTGVAVNALLANPVVGSVIGDVAVAILGGLPTEELANTVIQTVLTDGGLQAAVGFAIGQGIGSLLGDNIFGAILGQAAGLATTLLIGFVAPLALMAIPAPAAASTDSGSPTVAAWWLPAVVA